MPLRLARLFRKFFLAFFGAQIVTVVGVGLLIWAAGPEPHLPEPELREELAERLPPGMPLPPDSADPAAGHDSAAPGADPAQDAARSGKPPPGPGAGPLRTSPRMVWRHRLHRHGFPFLPVSVGLLASALFAYLLARQFAGPILALRQAFAEVGRGNFRLRLGPGTAQQPDELESLRNDFDDTMARLESLMEGQRRLMHDVSHEVRSPVARMQLALDLIRQQPARSEELLQRMERECGRVNQLMEELLTLSRLEARAFGPLDQTVDLVEVIQGVVEDADFEAQARGLQIRWEAPAHLECRGHAELLHRAIENVVRNALAHSPAQGCVTVQAEALAAGGFRIRIEDQGPGVPAGDLLRIFQPFKRLAGQANGEGHGLGLAITREALAVHGGTAIAQNRADGGLRVILEAPG